jgi:hypothetical protein
MVSTTGHPDKTPYEKKFADFTPERPAGTPGLIARLSLHGGARGCSQQATAAQLAVR